MNIQALSMLLARITVLDNRIVDQLTIEAWEPIVGDLDFEDALNAVNEHFRISTEYLVPAHIVEGAARARKQRLTLAQTTPHKFLAYPRRPDVCSICDKDARWHRTMGCAHLFDEISDYCVHCAVRRDRLPAAIQAEWEAA